MGCASASKPSTFRTKSINTSNMTKRYEGALRYSCKDETIVVLTEACYNPFVVRQGLLCMANTGAPNTNTSQFFFTLRDDDLEHLDEKHTIFGDVQEGFDVLDKLNEEFVDEDGRPYRDIRILHTHILDDPYDDPPALTPLVPPSSPLHTIPPQETVAPRLSATEADEQDDRTAEEIEKELDEKQAKSRAVVLEMLGDLPDADLRAPENVLFVCKLNPVTRDEDLELIFSRFGKVVECEIIKDFVTGDSLNYAFIEFDDVKACEEAYKKMDGVLIDDRRIHVDFSQSVAKIWNKYTERSRGDRKIQSQAERAETKKAYVEKKNDAPPPRPRDDRHGDRGDRRSGRGGDIYRESDRRQGRDDRRRRSRSRSRDRRDRRRSRSRSGDRRRHERR